MATQVDPVCGMQVDDQDAVHRSEYLGVEYYFCSEDCKHKFEQRPEDYVVRSRQAQRSGSDI